MKYPYPCHSERSEESKRVFNNVDRRIKDGVKLKDEHNTNNTQSLPY
jgi:hypothetical protein